jgi:hypothetical protein
MALARSVARGFGVGRLAYLLWHAPVGAIHKSFHAGGPLQQLVDVRGRREMARAAAHLPTSSGQPAEELPEIHFLTGNRFWFQSAFCLHSLQQRAATIFRVVFHDDGSLRASQRSRLEQLFPQAKIVTRAENDERLRVWLPPGKFPVLNERRRRYPNILKLTDIHAGRSDWRVAMDSDMLFFRRPDFLLHWLSAPDRPLHLVDIANAYGYSLSLMESLAGSPIPHRVNVGIAGLRSDQIDWEQLEFWCRRLIETEGTQYYLEQALVAMLVAKTPAAVTPERDYLVAPSQSECGQPTAVLHHYVADSKRWYFRDTWRTCVRPA